MMNIAIIGATSQIAKDLIQSLCLQMDKRLLLYTRDVLTTQIWLQQFKSFSNQCAVHEYSDYGKEPHEVVINFVGVGDPRRAAEMGSSIFDITQRYDRLILDDLRKNTNRLYIFLSSGAVYGNSFENAVGANTAASIDINNLRVQDYYSIAKLYAEATHRSYAGLSIMDVRVFNYFSRTQDLDARFFITDVVRAISQGSVLQTTDDDVVRDYISPSDFADLINCLINNPQYNGAVDCYTRQPVGKLLLLTEMKKRFALKYNFTKPESANIINATGLKKCYFSSNHIAKKFGYVPKKTALQSVIEEAEAIFL